MEIASFAYSNVLDTTWHHMVEDYKENLRNFSGKISVHGAFLDLVIHRKDEKIREGSQKRILQNLEIARILHGQYGVFHRNFNSLITHESYKTNWVRQNALFWSDVLTTYHCTGLLENMWEPRPDLFRTVLDTVKSSRLKICFDRGHAHNFSKAPFEEWISVLQDDIVYMHINDNNGDVDSELVPGDGSINWQEVSDVMGEYSIAPEIGLRWERLKKRCKQLTILEKRMFILFDCEGDESEMGYRRSN